MEHNAHQQQTDHELKILRFMEVTECESYQEAKFYVAMNNYVLKNAITAYLSSKGQKLALTSTNGSSDYPNELKHLLEQINEKEFSLKPEETLLLQQRLKDIANSRFSQTQSSFKQQNKSNMWTYLKCTCVKSLKCFEKMKKGLKKKINWMKNEQEKTFYFQQLYEIQLQQSGYSIADDLIESFELSSVQQNQKLIIAKNGLIRPIFAMISPNRKNALVSSLLKNTKIQRQYYDAIFLTLSQLREINLPESHSLRKIGKCPTVLIYAKNCYDLEEIFLQFQGDQLKFIQLDNLNKPLNQLPKFIAKWNYIIQIENKFKQNLKLSLEQADYSNFIEEDQDESNDTLSHNIQKQCRQSLIQQQTKIYQEMVSEQNKRKKSLELEKQRLDEFKQLRSIRKMSLPSEPILSQQNQSIEFKFRCPFNGEYITRNFLKSQKVDILYQFVDTNDQIQFEVEPQRQFDLFTSFPPTSLSEKKEQLLSEVFDQKKENILIRQL